LAKAVEGGDADGLAELLALGPGPAEPTGLGLGTDEGLAPTDGLAPMAGCEG
jgi:hypothetical protein